MVADATVGGQYDTWYKAVEDYIRRDLTVHTNKLPAISALAQVFQASMGDEYLAGLWRGDMLRSLLWSTYPTLTLSKAPSSRAPSWSWACHDNEVSYKVLPPPSSVPIARVLAATTTPLSDVAPLGEVTSGVLEIEGPVMTFPSEVTVWLMQKENDPPAIEDKAETRYKHNRIIMSKNKTDAGYRAWKPPNGHILLIFLVTPVGGSSEEAGEAHKWSRTKGLLERQTVKMRKVQVVGTHFLNLCLVLSETTWSQIR